MNNLNDKIHHAMDILRFDRDKVSAQLYVAAEKIVLEYLTQSK